MSKTKGADGVGGSGCAAEAQAAGLDSVPPRRAVMGQDKSQAAVICRPLVDAADLHAAYALDAEIWSAEEATPVAHLVAAVHAGGVVLGAWSTENPTKLLGFVYAFPAWEPGKAPWLISQAMAVRPEARDAGIGQRLKWAERAWALARGIDRVSWTWDPLEARNAHLNLNRLGAIGVAYLPDLYGSMHDALNEGVPSDRLWTEWHLRSQRVRVCAKAAEAGAGASAKRPARIEDAADTADTSCVRVPIPRAWQTLRREDPAAALGERLRVRAALMAAMALGYRVIGLDPDGPSLVLRAPLSGSIPVPTP